MATTIHAKTMDTNSFNVLSSEGKKSASVVSALTNDHLDGGLKLADGGVGKAAVFRINNRHGIFPFLMNDYRNATQTVSPMAAGVSVRSTTV